MVAGEYHSDGRFLLREGEPALLQAHFKLLKINRMHQTKAHNNMVKKKQFEDPTYTPAISEKTRKMAENRRRKILQSQ